MWYNIIIIYNIHSQNRLISDKIIGLTHNQSNLSVELINYKYKLAHLTEQISEATTEVFISLIII